MMDSYGCELYLRSPGSFGLPYGAPLSWEQISDVVSNADHQVAIGFMRGAVPYLLPSHQSQMALHSGDKIIVLGHEGF